MTEDPAKYYHKYMAIAYGNTPLVVIRYDPIYEIGKVLDWYAEVYDIERDKLSVHAHYMPLIEHEPSMKEAARLAACH